MFKSLNVKKCSCWKDNKKFFLDTNHLWVNNKEREEMCRQDHPYVGLDKNKIELELPMFLELQKKNVIRSYFCDALCEIPSSVLPWGRQVNFGGPLENVYALYICSRLTGRSRPSSVL